MAASFIFASRFHQLRTKFIPTWASLRSIGNSRAVQASVAFPAIGYLILLSSQFTSIFDGGLAGDVHHADSYFSHLWSLKLYFVYFGLLHLGVGSALYQWRCPRQIKKHGDWEDYVRIDGPAITSSYVIAIGKMIGRDPSADLHLNTKDGWQTLKIHYMQHRYALLSAEAKYFRAAVAYFFLFGLSPLLVPSLMTAIKIAILFLKTGR